jgi:hypothetical protein
MTVKTATKLSEAIDFELQIVRGDDDQWEFETENIQDQTADDITGAAINFTVRRDGDTDPVIEKSTSDGIAVSITETQKFTLELDGSDTEDLATDTYACDFEMTLAGKKETIGKGTFEILEDYTI